tara:strand:+ start:220 stop:384 length:165 start_codon:yes stop_codon:yes gene_type:complete
MSKKNNKPDMNTYYQQLRDMIKTIKKETGWRDIFKIVEEAQKRLKRKSSRAKPN